METIILFWFADNKKNQNFSDDSSKKMSKIKFDGSKKLIING